MKEIFHGLLVVTPLAALVLFFALTGKEEVKNDQRVQEATQTLKEQKFDNEFDDAWNGKPSKKVQAERNQNVAELKTQIAKAKVRRDDLDHMFDDATNDMKSAIREEDARLAADLKASKRSEK
jgi:TolA-binding protein